MLGGGRGTNTVLVLALTVLVFVSTLVSVSSAKAGMSTDPGGASLRFAVPTAQVSDSVSPTTTVVNPTTTNVKPLGVAATPVSSPSPALPWLYTTMIVSLAIFTAVTFLMFSFRRRGHRLSRIHVMALVLLVSLLSASTGQVYAEESSTVSIWDIGSTGV